MLRQRLLSLFLLLLCALPFWACGIEGKLEGQVKDHVPGGFVRVRASAYGATLYGTLDSKRDTASVGGTVVITGTYNGRDTTIVVPVRLYATGDSGGQYCLNFSDPVLIQFPSDATSFVATYTDVFTSVTAPMIVQEGLASVALSPTVTVTPEPGQKLVLFSVPDGLPGSVYEYAVSFSLGSIRPVAIKAALVGVAVCGDPLNPASPRFYPPVLPCGFASMTDLPPIVLPVSPVPVPLDVPLEAAVACVTGVDCSNSAPTGVGDNHGSVTPRAKFAPPSPNPTRTGTTVYFDLTAPAVVDVSVFDITGRAIATVTNERYTAGRHSVSWDGLSARRNKVTPGVYVLRLTMNGRVEGRHTVIVSR